MAQDIYLIFMSLIIAGCTQIDQQENQECHSDSECESGVCDFMKQDFGICAPVVCETGVQAQGISDISFFCNENNEWQKIKNGGERCDFDYECFRETTKDCPTCHNDYSYSCKNNTCTAEKQLNECEQQGLKRILRKDQYFGECIESIAQLTLPTVCAPCGNGVCNVELETKCNCPEDCQ